MEPGEIRFMLPRHYTPDRTFFINFTLVRQQTSIIIYDHVSDTYDNMSLRWVINMDIGHIEKEMLIERKFTRDRDYCRRNSTLHRSFSKYKE